jgi:predicted metal-binding protein
MKTFYIQTPKHNLKIESYSGFIETSKVKVDKGCFDKMCKEGCANFGRKYSCPPCSPLFNTHVKEKYLFVLLLKLDLDQFDSSYREYLKLQAGNAVLKSKIEKVMRALEGDGKFLATGSCRLCKPCKLKLKKPCKYPEKRRYSLESTGVDCDWLSKELFNVPMLWYKDKKAPKYTSVICGLGVENKKELEF